jgi:predicted aspartyl protease
LKIRFRIAAATILVVSLIGPVNAEPTTVAMHDKGASTFYVPVTIDGWGTGDFLVDTGSSYMTIDEDTLATLKESEQAVYVKDLMGTMADGRKLVVPVYRLSTVKIGSGCELHDVEAAVFPGSTRHILGLSALRRAAPFQFDIEPPTLHLRGCKVVTQTASLK